jgi:hypothetical protein
MFKKLIILILILGLQFNFFNNSYAHCLENYHKKTQWLKIKSILKPVGWGLTAVTFSTLGIWSGIKLFDLGHQYQDEYISNIDEFLKDIKIPDTDKTCLDFKDPCLKTSICYDSKSGF